MAQKPNKVLRIVVPIVLALAGIGIGWAVWTNTTRPIAPAAQTVKPAAPSGTGTAAATADGTTPGASNASPTPAPAPAVAGAPGGEVPAAQATAGGYRAQTVVQGTLQALGSLDPASGYQMEVQFSPMGAGLASLMLTNEFTSIHRTANEQLQRFHVNQAAPSTGVAPLAVMGIEVDGVLVQLGATGSEGETYWREVGPGHFEATIVDGAGEAVVRVTRRYELEKGSHDLVVRQSIENLRAAGGAGAAGGAVGVRWFQFGPVDLPVGSDRLSLDKRRVRFGYLNSPQIDPNRQVVDASRFMTERRSALGDPKVGTNAIHNWSGRPLWPNQTSIDKELTLSWVGMTSRHFCVVLHPLVDVTQPNPDKSLRLGAAVHSFVLPGFRDDGSDATLSVTLESALVSVAPGGAVSLDTGVFAGPQSKQFMTAKTEPRAAAVSLGKIVVYTLGGPCSFCTFQVLTGLLYAFLVILHNYVLHDYALGIILLVVCMRSLLHPVTRHAQISMQRFAKQMQALAPKQKKIQERYGSDQQKMREEMARLMREEHIPYSSAAKGCLTPFLQTPVWIALYAMLFFMFELRHTPAFYGVFQWASESMFGVRWSFLADLSEPDHFIPFGRSFEIPILSSLFLGKIDGLNLLPILLGVVFYIQQKYMTPPPTTPLTPEQEQQQRIMKIMMVLMFPLLMYSQPSGLTLYFVANSTLGIMESRLIRKHAEKMDLLKPTTPPPGRKARDAAKPGFFARLQAMAEQKQKDLERRQKGQQTKGRKK